MRVVDLTDRCWDCDCTNHLTDKVRVMVGTGVVRYCIWCEDCIQHAPRLYGVDDYFTDRETARLEIIKAKI